MAGKRQKPFNLLQDQRASRRREVYIPPPNIRYYEEDEDDGPDPGYQEAIDVAIDLIERALGQIAARNGDHDRQALEEMLRQAAAGGPRGGKRRYTPRSQRRPNAQRQQLAASRPRDAKGHFLPRGAAGTPDEAA